MICLRCDMIAYYTINAECLWYNKLSAFSPLFSQAEFWRGTDRIIIANLIFLLFPQLLYHFPINVLKYYHYYKNGYGFPISKNKYNNERKEDIIIYGIQNLS